MIDAAAKPAVSIVVIGRNEGERLVRCLESLRALRYPADRLEIIYVDSASTDDSCVRAEALADRVLAIRPEHPTAAAGRNAGWRAAHHDLVHFVDGDTLMHPDWLAQATEAMADAGVIAVVGQVAEVAPHASVYNFWAHHDWYRPAGRIEAAGGIALFRRSVVAAVDGFDETLIAGEEPEMCERIRLKQGGVILCLEAPMVRHDMNMTRFRQYWRRCTRTGYGYAEVARRHPGMQSWRRARWRNLVHAGAPLALGSVWPVIAWIALLMIAVVRNARRVQGRVGTLRAALRYSVHHYISKLPMALGQCRYWLRRRTGRRRQPLIEHRV